MTTLDSENDAAPSGCSRCRAGLGRPGQLGARACRRPTGDERIVVNMGPQHPSTHGVLRLILR